MEQRLNQSRDIIEEKPKSIFTFIKDEWKGDIFSFAQLSFGNFKSIENQSQEVDKEEWEKEVLQQLSSMPKITRKNSFTIKTKGNECLDYLGIKRDVSEFHTRSMIDIGVERISNERDLNSKSKEKFKDPLNDSIDKAIAHSSSLSIESTFKKAKKKSQCLMSYKRIKRRKSMIITDNILAFN